MSFCNDYKYKKVTHDEGEIEDAEPVSARRKLSQLAKIAIPTAFLMLLVLSAWRGYVLSLILQTAIDICRAWLSSSLDCDTPQDGFACSANVSHFWGQYSPFHRVPSKVSDKIPHHCNVTFVQMLSRHGARDPTAFKSLAYHDLITTLKKSVESFHGKYAFLASYEYTLGADQLTVFGQQQMVNSGIKFYKRYRELGRENIPFVRASGQKRVVDSATNWTRGFHETFLRDKCHGRDKFPYEIVVMSEEDGTNNTLNHHLCTAFESGPVSQIGRNAQLQWIGIFVPPIQKRLNSDLPGANFSKVDVINFMDLCPFETVASSKASLSPFCNLFSEEEWHQFDYYQSLGKYYGFGPGNPLGPTQGVGWVNELIARLTHAPLNDSTSTNHTLDDNPTTFPIDIKHKLFADFSHDNDMTSIMGALGLYNLTNPLPVTFIESPDDVDGYSAAWTVPFAARVYIEKLQCAGEEDELVRVLVNDRVIPMSVCGGESSGFCKLGDFISSLAFARNGGHWDQCFVS